MTIKELIKKLNEFSEEFGERQDIYVWEDGERPKGEDLKVVLSNNVGEPQLAPIMTFPSSHPLTHEEFVSIEFVSNNLVNWVK